MMRGLLGNYETVAIVHIETYLNYTKTCVFAHTEVIYTMTESFHKAFFEVMSRILGRVHFEKLSMESDQSITVE